MAIGTKSEGSPENACVFTKKKLSGSVKKQSLEMRSTLTTMVILLVLLNPWGAGLHIGRVACPAALLH